MPSYFAGPRVHLSNLPVTTKIGITGFVLAVLAGLAFSAYPLFADRTGFTARGVRENFVGVDFDSMSDAEQEAYLTRLREEGRPISAPKTPRQRADIVHPHSFMMPVLYFILIHLMEMTGTPRALRLGLYVVAFLAMAFATFAPILVPAVPGMAFLVVPAFGVLWGSFAVMGVVPTARMWGRPPE